MTAQKIKVICLVAVLVLLVGHISWATVDGGRWKHLKDDAGVALYQSETVVAGHLPFKAVATVAGTTEQIVMALVDAEGKGEWAPKVKSSVVHTELSSNRFEFSEYYTTPWPFWDREFLLVGKVDYYPDRVVFSAINSAKTEHADPGHVLVDVAVLDFEIVPVDSDHCRVTFTFSGEFGGYIPAFVKTIIQEKWPVRFIQALQLRIQQGGVRETPRYRSLVKG